MFFCYHITFFQETDIIVMIISFCTNSKNSFIPFLWKSSRQAPCVRKLSSSVLLILLNETISSLKSQLYTSIFIKKKFGLACNEDICRYLGFCINQLGVKSKTEGKQFSNVSTDKANYFQSRNTTLHTYIKNNSQFKFSCIILYTKRILAAILDSAQTCME